MKPRSVKREAHQDEEDAGANKILQAMEEIINMVVLKQHRNYSHQKVKHSPSLITKWNIAFSYPPSGQTSVNLLVYTPTFIFSILFRILKTLKTQVCFKRTAGENPNF